MTEAIEAVKIMITLTIGVVSMISIILAFCVGFYKLMKFMGVWDD